MHLNAAFFIIKLRCRREAEALIILKCFILALVAVVGKHEVTQSKGRRATYGRAILTE